MEWPDAPLRKAVSQLFSRDPLPFSRRDWLFAASLAVASLVLPFIRRSQHLLVWDSVLFAHGVESYDFLRGHPHPPGYPVFVAFAAFLRPLLGVEGSLAALSIVFGALSTALLYLVSRNFAGPFPSLLGSALFAMGPSLVYNAAEPLSYTAEGAASLAVAFLAYRARNDLRMRNVVSLAAVFGLALGLRASLLFFLTPLFLWALAPQSVPRRALVRRFAVAAAAASGVVVAWFIPMLLAGGGLRDWLATTSVQSREVVFAFTVFNGGIAAVQENGGRILSFLRPESAALLLTLGAVLAMTALRRRPRPGLAGYVLAWALPSILFYTFVFSGFHKGPRGYVLVFLPAFFVVLASSIQTILDHFQTPGPDQRKMRIALGTIGAAFLVSAPFTVAATDRILDEDIDQPNQWAASWLALRGKFDPEDTILLASGSFAFASWYFPEFTVWGYMPGTPAPGGGPWHVIVESKRHVDDTPVFGIYVDHRWIPSHPIPNATRTIVVFDFQLAGENGGPRVIDPAIQVQERRLQNGWRILVFEPDASHPTIESCLDLGPAPAPSP